MAIDSLQKRYIRKNLFGAPSSVSIRRPNENLDTYWHLRNRSSYSDVMCMTLSTFFVNKNTINTALHTSGKDVQEKVNCIVGVYWDWVYNSN